MEGKVTAILPCAGKGTRAKLNENKLFYEIEREKVVTKTVNAFKLSNLVDEIILAVNENDFEKMRKLFPGLKIVLGGDTRTQSIKNALETVEDGIVIIHDGARPFITTKIISDAIDSVKNFGSGICVIKTRDTVAREKDGTVTEYLGKEDVISIQTPQAFFVRDIKKAYNLAGNKSFNDDGEVFKTFIGNPHCFVGSIENVKLTYPEDFVNNSQDIRYGNGFDCHKLVENRKLILGGITIPHDKGLLGHSDADVLTHAIMDAILSSAGLNDIGYYFPDNDQKYLDADSILLLKEVLKMVEEKRCAVKNVCATIMAQKPKLMPFIPSIKENLAKILGLDEGDVGITATTLEGLGFVGREEGICVYATCVIAKLTT